MRTIKNLANQMNKDVTKHCQQNDLLLYSLISFRSIIEPILRLARPDAICEIGVEKGFFTQFLVDYCSKSACRYTGIDPTIEDVLAEPFKGDRVVFLKDRSIQALRTLAPHDIYFIDGDHNYYTVKNELSLIVRHAGHGPLIFLHDVYWPWGRRDQYCSPATIPPASRHPYSTELGVVPGKSGLQEGGFCGQESDYSYAAATEEGGPHNGVLTAVEDVIEEQGKGDWQLIIIPAVFGLGILYSPRTCNSNLLQHVQGLSNGLNNFEDFLALLEKNRVHLFLTYLKQVKQHQANHQAYTSLESAYGELSGQFKGLEDNYRDLSERYQELHHAYGDLHQHDVALQSAYDDLLSYSKWLEAELNKMRPT